MPAGLPPSPGQALAAGAPVPAVFLVPAMSNPAIVYRGREPFVQTNRLSAEARRQLWAAMQQHEPDMVDLLQNDAFFNALKTRFDGAVALPLEQYRRLMKTTINHGEIKL